MTRGLPPVVLIQIYFAPLLISLSGIYFLVGLGIFYPPRTATCTESSRKGAWRDSSHSRVRNSRAVVVSQNDAQVVAIIGWPCTLFYEPRRANELSWSRSSGYRPGENFFEPSSFLLLRILLSLVLSVLLSSSVAFRASALLLPGTYYNTYVWCFRPCGLLAVRWTCRLIKVQWRLQGSRDGAENH